jgi:D-alanyl-D-alanine carboxypeptidase/D-alanyl-D-alanine-endopeptidase (penicillin-binding protein 4)
VVALVLAGCGGASHPTGKSTVSAAGPPGAAVAAPPALAVPPALARLRAALGRATALAGAGSGASIFDLGADSSLFALRDEVRRPPASLEKLYTTVAVLSKLGPDAQLQTSVLGAGHLAPGGFWEGDLYLKGGGDPTFGDGGFNRVWEQGYGPTAAELAQQIRSDGIRSVSGQLIGDASLLDERPGGPATGYAPDIPDFGGQLSALTYDHGASSGALTPAAFAARQLARTLRAEQVRVRAATQTGHAPGDARSLASVSSPPMSVLLRLMDVPSDDLFAELLTEQLGLRFGGAGTISAGARVIARVVAGYGLHPRIVDGSGLSRSDRSSPAELVDLLQSIWHTEIGHVVSASLPVVGLSGTVAGLATRTAAQGHCIAKTGTLNDVTNLAGYCATRGQHVVAFALFIDGPANSRAMVLLSRMVAAIASY